MHLLLIPSTKFVRLCGRMLSLKLFAVLRPHARRSTPPVRPANWVHHPLTFCVDSAYTKSQLPESLYIADTINHRIRRAIPSQWYRVRDAEFSRDISTPGNEA
jgi:hypothetical protein